MTQVRPSNKTLVWKYLAIGALPLLALFYTPIVDFTILALGEPALLRTIPVDPRDFLRGDYVRLDYAISRIPDGLIAEELRENGHDPRRNTAVYVELRKDEAGVASVAGVTLSPPRGLYIKGALYPSTGRCDYGLGVYYVPEGTGYELEQKITNSEVYADVRLFRGRGVIKELKASPIRETSPLGAR